jgi:hypothetical protein
VVSLDRKLPSAHGSNRTLIADVIVVSDNAP